LIDSNRNAHRREHPLAGLGIIVTRPRHQAESFCRRIEAAGGRAIRLPVLDICEPEDTSRLETLIDRLGEFDIAIFISVNAVRQALPRIRARGGSLTYLKLAAIGQKTAQALTALGLPVDILPRQGFTSEDLLELDEMQTVRGRRIVIFRGEGGLELLSETLQARGAAVEYAEVYRRIKPDSDPQAIRGYFDNGAVDLITITSSEGLRNLEQICEQALWSRLHQIPLLVGSHRMLEAARKMGFVTVRPARDPSDEAMFEDILRWAEQRHRGNG